MLVPGLVAGSAFAILPRFVGDCGARTEPVVVATEQGAFVGPASVSVRTGCGTFNLRTAPGSGWQLDAGSSLGRAPSIEASGDSLAIRSTAGHGLDALGGGRDRWDLSLPAGEIDALAVVANANRSHLDLAGARIGSLAVTGNAAEVVVDATSASVAELSAVMNTGVLSIHLPASNASRARSGSAAASCRSVRRPASGCSSRPGASGGRSSSKVSTRTGRLAEPQLRIGSLPRRSRRPRQLRNH